MRFDNEFAAVEEGAVEVENNELHWNDSDGWMTEQIPHVYSSFERLLDLQPPPVADGLRRYP
jgi:hypothetical protein